MKFIEYDRKSIRLKSFDYSQNGYYYVTLCTKDREECFGNVVNGKVHYSKIGQIVHDEWIKTEQVRENVKLDIFVIMPNHLHGIIIIENNYSSSVGASRWDAQDKKSWAGHRSAPTTEHASTQHTLNPKFRLKPDSLGSIICQFKSNCTKRIWEIGFKNFHWQRNYYEHIIRNEKDLFRIQNYIQNNPLEWTKNTKP